ncbi:MAG: hypothetical protein IT373_04725 [Polyangiaceae bacterium]|nr:hypothetical protein [Polyangiaceae bacterium]
MHRSLLLCASLLAASCNWPAGTSSTGSGGGDAGVQCPETEGCSACVQCALASPCQALYQICLASLACKAIDECFAGCGVDKACQQACYAAQPSGAQAYDALLTCVECDECPSACPGLCTSP